MSIDNVETGSIISSSWGNAVANLLNLLSQPADASRIANGAVSADKIASNAVTTAKIQDGAVTEDKIASNSITTGKIASGAVQSGDIASNAVTTAKINNGAVTEDKIGTGAVTSAKIANGTITNTDISSSAAISTTKLSVEYIPNDNIRFVKIGELVLCWVQNATTLLSGDKVPNGWEPNASTTFMIHRHNDAAHRAVTVSTNGNMTVDGRDGNWSGYAFWMT